MYEVQYWEIHSSLKVRQIVKLLYLSWLSREGATGAHGKKGKRVHILQENQDEPLVHVTMRSGVPPPLIGGTLWSGDWGWFIISIVVSVLWVTRAISVCQVRGADLCVKVICWVKTSCGGERNLAPLLCSPYRVLSQLRALITVRCKVQLTGYRLALPRCVLSVFYHHFVSH